MKSKLNLDPSKVDHARSSAAKIAQSMQDFIDIYQKGYAPKSAPEDGYQQIMDAYYKGLTNMPVADNCSCMSGAIITSLRRCRRI